jgi:hypothetical protein
VGTKDLGVEKSVGYSDGTEMSNPPEPPGNTPLGASGSDGPLEVERQAGRLRRRVGLVLGARAACWSGAALAVAWGALLIALRAGLGVAGPGLAWGSFALAAVALGGLVWGWRRRPSAAAILARLEAAGEAGGLFLTAAESGLGDWGGRLPAVPTVHIRWRGGRALLALGAGVAFATFAGLLPAAPAAEPGTTSVATPAGQLAERLEALEELGAVEPAAVEAWQQELGDAEDLAAAGEMDRAWQSLDAVATSVAEAQRVAADAAVVEADHLARAADAVASGADPPSALAGAPEANAGQPAALEGTPQALDAAGRAALAAELAGASDAARKIAEALRSGARLDAESLRQAGVDERGLESLLAARRANAGEGGKEPSQRFGRGGVDRGRGDAPLLFDRPSHNAGVELHDEPLAPSAVAGLDESVVLATDAARPPPGGGAASAPGSLGSATPGGGAAFTEVVLPQHRAAVRRYFDRPGGP